MEKTRIKIVVPQELVEDLSTIEGFEIDKTAEESAAIKDFDFNLSALINPENMNTLFNATISVFGFLSSVNGSILLAEKIKKYIKKPENKTQQIRIFTSSKQYIIDQNTAPEVFQELENFLTK